MQSVLTSSRSACIATARSSDETSSRWSCGTRRGGRWNAPRCLGRVVHSLTHSFIHSLTHSLIHSFIHSLIYSFIHLFIHWIIDLLVCWIDGWMDSWFVDWERLNRWYIDWERERLSSLLREEEFWCEWGKNSLNGERWFKVKTKRWTED